MVKRYYLPKNVYYTVGRYRKQIMKKNILGLHLLNCSVYNTSNLIIQMLTVLKKIFDKLLPPREKIFFDFFQQGAEICDKLAVILFDIIHEKKERGVQVSLSRNLKRESYELTNKTLKRLNLAFMTPVDREDIQNISILLNKIARTITKGCSFLNTYQLSTFNDMQKAQTATLVEATHELKYAISLFRNFKNTDAISQSSDRMDSIETKGDEIICDAMSDLFSGKYDALTVIKLRDLYKDVEQALDLCFFLSDTLVNISLKHT
jgi:uncharacterized protein Yka (UPF0111/DUF47 family)